jgi:hypothetical protein
MEARCTQCYRIIIGATGPGLCWACGQVNANRPLWEQGTTSNMGYDNLSYDSLMATMEKLRAQHDQAKPPDPVTLLRDRAERAELEVQRLKVQLARSKAEIAMLTVYKRTESVNGTLSQNMLTKILSLVHPDRHGNSELANEVTRYILSLRK